MVNLFAMYASSGRRNFKILIVVPVETSGSLRIGGLVGCRSMMLVNDVTKTRAGKKLSVYRKVIEKK
jgi:hypothetical protein